MTELTKILDVGCGGKPIGTVNCDLFIGESPHTGFFIQKARNFVRCDAQYLPFRDATFDIVHGSHIIEHLRHPFFALKEFRRTAKKFVCIRIPNTAGVRLENQNPKHLYCWDKSTLSSFLSEFFPRVQVYHASQEYIHGKILDRIYLLKRFLSFIIRKLLPSELIAICEK